jgi:predicted outer membrane protein
MNRRFLLVAAGFAGATPAAAQTGSAAPMGGATAPATGARLGNLEVEHGKKTTIAGAATLETSKIALAKASDPRVKQFAQFEFDEQTTLAGVLEAYDPSYGAARPDARMSSTIQALVGMGAGPDFDKAYVKSQIEGHKLLIEIQEDYLKTGSNRERVAIAKMTRGVIKEHLALLDQIQAALG